MKQGILIGCLCQLALAEAAEEIQTNVDVNPIDIPDSPEKIQTNVEPISDDIPEYDTQLKALKAKMLTLNELNVLIKQKIVDQLNRIGLTKKCLTDMRKNIHSIYPTSQEVTNYINFSFGIYDKALTQPELFDTLSIDAFSSRLEDHNISQDQINAINELLDTAIENAKINQALIEEGFNNEKFEKIEKRIEKRLIDLENHIQLLTDTVAQFELQTHDEGTISRLKSHEIVEIARICDEMHELFFEEPEDPSNAFILVLDVAKQMADIQRDLIESIAQA